MVLLEGGKNSRVKMLRHGATIALRNDVHGLPMVECGLIRPLAAQDVVDVAGTHNARRQRNSLTPLAIRVTFLKIGGPVPAPVVPARRCNCVIACATGALPACCERAPAPRPVQFP